MSSPDEIGRPADAHFADVETREDAARTVRAMLADLQKHPGAWENPTLERFLEALAASITDLDAAYTARGERLPDQPTWRTVAELLVMASDYE
ncbi:MAG TPA: hypothetical protein VGO94_06955 [Mycobacteriales bacterium]|jgi:hypothetical protein|nr:hypothetical protein [Cryptosporangiaceae bacterium]MDQ1678083.1 hypothetical protein [Actinomycetota bacterium]HEV7755584.1 hypothetical protein [Mycobacteriales bacterium]